MKAVLVVELDLPDDDPDALQDAVRTVGHPDHAVQMHAAINQPASDVLAVFKETR